MPLLSRRRLLGALLAAPAIIRTPGLLMPVKTLRLPEPLVLPEALVLRYLITGYDQSGNRMTETVGAASSGFGRTVWREITRVDATWG